MCSIFDKLMGRIGIKREPVSRGAQQSFFTLLCIIFHEKGTSFVFLLLTKWNPFHIPSLELWVPFRLVTSRPLISRPVAERVSRSTCFAWMDLNHIINSRGKKMIKISCVGSRVEYHLLSYWSFVMTSPVEVLTGEFRAKQVWKVR